jgi:uncharacterized protein (TIGR03790 family)
MRRAAVLLAILTVSIPDLAHAVPGPDSVAVLANASVPGSVALAMRYAEARDIPSSQVCILPMPSTDDIALDVFESDVLEPLRACLGASEARIEAIVVMRGVPLRVLVPIDGGHNVSLAAALGTWRSTLADGTTPLLGTAPGSVADCGGTPCYAARVASQYRAEPFRAGLEVTVSGIIHRPVLVTMLHGRSDADAERLIDVALAAEATTGAEGEFLFMTGADTARGALDLYNEAIAAQLVTRGFDARVVPFDPDLTGRTLASFTTGTASLGTTIEGNTYAPGALVDNLTSYGAVPVNFMATGESQVSIARWVASGAAGVHGTVDEPLNNVFPSRALLVRYVDGATLSEAFLGAMPYTYWLNLVLGDPMLAPYARRPDVIVSGTSDGATVTSAVALSIEATPPDGRAIERLSLFVDGEEIATSAGEPLSHCLAIAPGELEVLVVATTAAGVEGGDRPWPAKGWSMLHLTGTATDATCDAPVDASTDRDAGARDGSAGDAGASAAPPSGCGCHAAGGSGDGRLSILVLLALLGAVFRRRRRALGSA